MAPEHDEVSIATIGKDIEKTSVYEVVNDNKHARIGLSNDDAEFFESFPKEKAEHLWYLIQQRLIHDIEFQQYPLL